MVATSPTYISRTPIHFLIFLPSSNTWFLRIISYAYVYSMQKKKQKQETTTTLWRGKMRINVPLIPRIRTQIRHFTSVKAAHLKPPGDTCLQLRLAWWPRSACIIHGDIFKRCMTPRSPSLLREIRRICECNFSRTSRDSCPTPDPSAFVIDSL